MRFLMMVYSGENSQGPTPELVAEMSKFNQKLDEAGALLALDGLFPPSMAASVTFNGPGRSNVIDGPFTEAKEMVGGFWIIKADSRDAAVEWARQAPMPEGARIEVRQIADREDYSEEVQEARVEFDPPEQTRS